MDEAELQSELEMVEAMYSDAVTITGVNADELHRQVSRDRSNNICGESGMLSACNTTSGIFSTGARTSSFSHHDEDGGAGDAAEDGGSLFTHTHQVIVLHLRKNVQIEITVPSRGYLRAPSNKPRIRVDVLSSPVCVDSEKLLQALKQVIRDHHQEDGGSGGGGGGSGGGGSLIAICQAAEHHVETVLEQQKASSSASSDTSKSDDGENIDAEDDYQQQPAAALSSDTTTAAAGGNMRSFRTNSSSNNNNSSPASIESAGHAVHEYPAELLRRGIIRGSNPIIDRKSKFLAHACPISSERDALQVVELLRSMNSINQACHPAIWAYRFTHPVTKAMSYDCDDDGEKNGARNIQFVLEQMGADGWIVIVTRYFGGTLLGPDRFRYIASVTRSVLEEAGVGTASVAVGGSGKKK